MKKDDGSLPKQIHSLRSLERLAGEVGGLSYWNPHIFSPNSPFHLQELTILSFSVAFLNIGTLNNKLDFAHDYVSSNDILVFALNETWLDHRTTDSAIASRSRSF